jgi:hypothetical protein
MKFREMVSELNTFGEWRLDSVKKHFLNEKPFVLSRAYSEGMDGGFISIVPGDSSKDVATAMHNSVEGLITVADEEIEYDWTDEDDDEDDWDDDWDEDDEDDEDDCACGHCCCQEPSTDDLAKSVLRAAIKELGFDKAVSLLEKLR